MGLIFLLSWLMATVSALADPCSNCPLPVAFEAGDASLCQNQQIDDSYSPVLIKHSYGGRCYLQMTDCPAYDIVSGSQCVGILPPQQALECIGGKFRTPGRVTGLPINKIRCNPDAYITPLPNNVVWSDCSRPDFLSETDTTSCGNTGLPGIDMTRTSNGTHLQLILSRCENYDIVIGYDETGTCRKEKTPKVPICENGRFKIDGREVHKIRCSAKEGSEPDPPINCNEEGWHYYWFTDSSYKIGFNKNYWEAKAACAAEGAQLASIHNTQELAIIMFLIYAKNETASIGEGTSTWIGLEPDGIGGFINLDQSQFNFAYWAPEYPTMNGSCVRILSRENPISGNSGEWENVICATQTDSYICKRSTLTPVNCTNCRCAFKEMLENWRFQSCFNGGSFTIEESLIINGKAPPVTAAGDWSISLVTSNNVHALRILITNWGDDQPKMTIASALDGYMEEVTYDCPYRPDADYKFQVINLQHQLLLLFNGVEFEHTHFVSNPANDYWGVAIIIPETIPKLYNAKIIDKFGEILDELGLGHAEAVNCNSCAPFAQKTTEVVGASNGILSATYDSTTGCTKATITCTGTGPEKMVAMHSHEGYAGMDCNAVSFTDAFTCGNNGVWIGPEGQEAAPLAQCSEISSVGCGFFS